MEQPKPQKTQSEILKNFDNHIAKIQEEIVKAKLALDQYDFDFEEDKDVDADLKRLNDEHLSLISKKIDLEKEREKFIKLS